MFRILQGGFPTILDPRHPDMVYMHTMANISGATLVDETPNGNDFTLANTPTTGGGPTGSALTFNGTSQYGYSAVITPLTAALTFAQWLRPDGASDATQAASFDQMSNVVYYHSHSNATFRGTVSAHTGGAWVNCAASGITDTSNFTLVIGTWDGATLRYYKNASLIGSVGMGSVRTQTNNRWGLASNITWDDSTSGGQYFDGSIGMSRLYSRALTQGEINQLYDEGV